MRLVEGEPCVKLRWIFPMYAILAKEILFFVAPDFMNDAKPIPVFVGLTLGVRVGLLKSVAQTGIIFLRVMLDLLIKRDVRLECVSL